MTKRLSLILALLLATAAGSAAAEKVAPEQGFLGVGLTLPHDVRESERENGLYVDRVIPGGAAEAAGVRAHDRIVAIDGKAVTSIDELRDALGPPEQTVHVTLAREGAEQTVSVQLGRVTERQRLRWGLVLDHKRAVLGLHIEELGRQLAEYFGVESGLLVTEVLEDGPAERAGLRAGDILVEVGDQPIAGRKTLHLALAHVEPGSEIAIQVQRRGAPLTLFVTTGNRERHRLSIDLKQLHWLVESADAEDNVEVVVPDGDVQFHLRRPDGQDGD